MEKKIYEKVKDYIYNNKSHSGTGDKCKYYL